jgi:uncharacterized surface protein with fasciclin (FAS1) repeats
VAAVKAAGLVELLRGRGPLRFFAPTNEASTKVPEETVEILLKPENKSTLIKILTAHVVAGTLTSADLIARIKKIGVAKYDHCKRGRFDGGVEGSACRQSRRTTRLGRSPRRARLRWRGCQV